MTEQQYKAFLDALARKHLNLVKCRALAEKLAEDVEALAAVARFLHVVQERVERMEQKSSSGYAELYRTLGREIHAAPAGRLVETLRKVGLLAALDEDPETLLHNLSSDVIPPEDLELLRRCGILDPGAELTLLLAAAVDHGVEWPLLDEDQRQSRPPRPSRAFEEAAKKVEDLGASMAGDHNDKKPVQKRKILNGIGNILGGLVTAGGNVLVYTGTFLAPNPATGYLAAGSAGAATVLVFKGLGDLRSE